GVHWIPRGRSSRRRARGVRSLCSALSDYFVWSPILQTFCPKPASKGLCARGHRCRCRRNRRSCLHLGSPLPDRHYDCDNWNCDARCPDADQENTGASHDIGCGSGWSRAARQGGMTMFRGGSYRTLATVLLLLCSAEAQTLKKVASIDLSGPKGKRFDYLTMDDEDHWLLSAHLGTGILYVIDVRANMMVKAIVGVLGIKGEE